MNTPSIPLNLTKSPCAHYAGKVTIAGTTHVASFAVDGCPVPVSMAEIFERTRSFIARVGPDHYLVSLNWHNFVQVLGTGEHCEAILKATVVRGVEVDRCIDTEAPVEFRRVVKLLFALDMTEEQIRAETYELAQAAQTLQTFETLDVGSKCVNA